MSNSRKFTELIRWNDRPTHQTANIGEYAIASLTDRTLSFQNNGVEMSLKLGDVVGVSAEEISPHEEEASFRIHAYPLVTCYRWLGWGKKRQRRLQTYHFACPNRDVRSRWMVAIQNILLGLPLDSPTPTVKRRLKIFLNPISGKKQGKKIFETIRPLLENSYLEYTLTETTYAGEIQDTLRQAELSEIDGIVLVGGDGSIHEAINGLMSRCDRETAILKPIGVIPSGTGNGLAKTLLEIAGEPEDPVSAAFLIAKGKQRPLDIAITQQNERRYYSFLSLSWGIVSDVDIESERLRFLGTLRTDIYALIRIWRLRNYPGKFSYLPATETTTSSQSECQAFEKCLPCFCDPERNLPDRPSSLELSNDEWQAIEDDFVLFWAMNMSHATHDIKAAPKAHLSDGNMDVILGRHGISGISKLNLLLAFIKSAKGEHLSLPGIEYYKVRRFRLEPKTDRGILAVDGEKVAYFPIQMEVKRGLARVFCG